MEQEYLDDDNTRLRSSTLDLRDQAREDLAAVATYFRRAPKLKSVTAMERTCRLLRHVAEQLEKAQGRKHRDWVDPQRRQRRQIRREDRGGGLTCTSARRRPVKGPQKHAGALAQNVRRESLQVGTHHSRSLPLLAVVVQGDARARRSLAGAFVGQ